MSSLDFGQEQLTQPPLDMSETQGLNEFNLLELMYELSQEIGEIRPASNQPVTIYLGGDAAAVFNGVRNRSVDGLRVFAATPLEASIIARVASSLDAENELRIFLTDRSLQDEMDAVPRFVQTLTADAASIEPLYSCPVLEVIIPRWEVPYATKMYELAFENPGDRALRWTTHFLLCYLFSTPAGPSQGYVLESLVQDHVRAVHPQETRYVPRSTFDQVNRKCKESSGTEPILFEG